MSKDFKIIATFNDYPGMLAAMRARAQERRIAISSDAVATIAGLPDCYISKLLSPRPVKRIGMISLGPLLGVLGAKLVMVEDVEAIKRTDRIAIAKFGMPLKPRNEASVHNGAVHVTLSRRFLQKIGAIGGANSRKNLSTRQRTLIARRAAIARWSAVLLLKGKAKALPPAAGPGRRRRRSAGNGAAKGPKLRPLP